MPNWALSFPAISPGGFRGLVRSRYLSEFDCGDSGDGRLRRINNPAHSTFQSQPLPGSALELPRGY